MEIVCYDRDSNILPADNAEKWGDFGFGLLRMAFGHTVKITKTPYGTLLESKTSSTAARITAFILSPIGVFLALFGAIAYRNSQTRNHVSQGCKKIEEADAKQKESLKKITLCREHLQKYSDQICSTIPQYAKVEVEPKSVTEEDLLSQLEKAIQSYLDRKDAFGPDEKLIEAKTRFLKMRDIAKFNQYQGRGIPNPSPEMPLSSNNSFDFDLPLSEEPLTEIPQYLYKFDHPRDSSEGKTALSMFIATERAPSSNWKVALQYVEGNVLQKPLQDLTPDALYKLIFDIHEKIVGGVEPLREIFSMVIDPDSYDSNFPSMYSYLENNFEDAEILIKRLKRFEQKLNRWGSVEGAAPYITPKQWAVFSKIVFVPPAPENLDLKLKSFLQNAVKVMKDKNYHPYQVAAYLHYGLTTLHLFGDGNGRLSRLMANIYLMQNGFKPFYVVSDRKYSTINKEEVYDVAFCRFLLENNAKMNTSDEPDESDDQDGCVMQ